MLLPLFLRNTWHLDINNADLGIALPTPDVAVAPPALTIVTKEEDVEEEDGCRH